MTVATRGDPLSILRRRLLEVGYHLPAHAAMLSAARGTPAERLDAALELTEGDDALSVALRLFAVGADVTRGSAARAVGDEAVHALVERGLLERVDGRVRSRFAVAFLGEAAAAQDFLLCPRPEASEELVTPVAGATRMLISLTVPASRGRVLEIGTGQGLPIAAASTWAGQAVGTDISRRALRCAALTAALNDRTNVELREGSLFEPVAGEPAVFDSLISNPPFVLSPAGAQTALSSGPGNDQASFTERVVRGAGAVLRDGGFATILGNWGHAAGSPWDAPVRGWMENAGCDAMVLGVRTQSARQYAVTWRREMRLLEPARDPAPLEAWLSMFERLGWQEITFGVIVLRRRNGSNWFHAERRSTAGLGDAGGAQLRRWFDGRTALHSAATPQALLQRTFRVAPSLELVGRPAPIGKADFGVLAGVLRQTDGWPEAMQIDPLPLAVLMGCDGRRDLRGVIAASASSRGMNADRLQALVLPLVRRWLEMGYLS
ncbi:MAG: methyltransferase [Planctomycetota bacterium]|nr:methyltransferase [Planctomycetota bacterium]